GLAEDRFGHLLHAVVDRAYHRHPVDDALAPGDERPADEALGDPAHEHGEYQEDDHADAPDVDRRVLAEEVLDQSVGLVGGRDEGQDPAVDPARDGPDQPERQADGRDDDEAGQEVRPQAGDDPAPSRRMV